MANPETKESNPGESLDAPSEQPTQVLWKLALDGLTLVTMLVGERITADGTAHRDFVVMRYQSPQSTWYLKEDASKNRVWFPINTLS